MSYLKKLFQLIPVLFFGLLLACSGDDEPNPATCTDGIQNGNEEGVDCGGECSDCFNASGRFAENVFPEYLTISIGDFYGEGTEITYGKNTFPSGAEQDLKLTLYGPNGDTESQRPIILMMGGFPLNAPSINKQLIESYDYAQNFVGKGFVVAMVNTRYYDKTEEFTVEDAKDAAIKARADLLAAIRFFRKEAEQYKIDTDNIWLMGYSGGGLVSMLAAYLNEDDAADLDAQLVAAIDNNGGFAGDSGNPGFDNSVKGVINLAGFMFDDSFADPEDKPALFSLIGFSDQAHPLECASSEVSWITGIMTTCGPGAIEKNVSDVKTKIITVSPANANAPIDPAQCPECADEITDFIAERL